jgi:hypothetical protein
MIHHLSIAALDPKHSAEVLAGAWRDRRAGVERHGLHMRPRNQRRRRAALTMTDLSPICRKSILMVEDECAIGMILCQELKWGEAAACLSRAVFSQFCKPELYERCFADLAELTH